MPRALRCLKVVVSPALVSLLLTGCGGGGSKSTPTAPTPLAPLGTTASVTYKFFLDDGVSRKRVDVVPAAVAQKATAGKKLKKNDLGIHPLDDPGTGTTDGVVFSIAPDDLLVAAAAECGMVGDSDHILGHNATVAAALGLQDIALQEQNGVHLPVWKPNVPAWQQAVTDGEPPFYIFEVGPQTCDDVLEYEEELVCVADKLAQLADTTGPLEWHAASGWTFANGTSVSGPTWVMPPPAEAEKFIVRDLAFSVLAQIPLLDSQGPASSPSTNCPVLYESWDAALTKDQNVTQLLFGYPTVPPAAPAIVHPPLPAVGSGMSISQERATFRGSLLRASGQLLHDIVRESVYSDLAGAAANAASASDPRAGQALGFGVNGNAPYDSLAHVAKTLMGRLETSADQPDPACWKVAAGDLFATLADPGTRARANDLGATTSNAAVAETLLEETGIVAVDGATIDAATVTNQLLAIKASVVAQSTTAFASTPSGQAIASLVASVSASDLARAVVHNQTTFSLLTNSATSDATQMAAAASAAGLTVDSSAGIALGSGIVISGGISRSSVATDPVARTGAMAAASGCDDYAGLPGLLLDQAVAPPSDGSQLSFTRQDVFATGQALRSRLVKLREAADGSATSDSSQPVDAQARAAAVAELGAWAGTGRMIASSDSSTLAKGAATHLFVDLVGVSPSDFGVNQLSDLTSVISVVSDPQLAECAAGISKTTCNAAALAAAQLKSPTVSSSPLDTAGAATPSATLRAQYGLTGGYVRLSFPLSGPTGANGTWYVVASIDPATGLGSRQVLGAMTLNIRLPYGKYPPSFTFVNEASTVLSPMRRELLSDAFSLGKWVGAAPPQAGELPIAGTPSFCIEGVPRDLFVPLENDLTDQTDNYENSWSHYLTAAQTAAQRADDLGQTLVDIGFQNTTNVENAAEQLQTGLGSPTNVDNLSIDSDGTIDAGALNGALSAVLNQPTIDVVFFSADPLGCLPPSVTNGQCSDPTLPYTCGSAPTALQLYNTLQCPPQQADGSMSKPSSNPLCARLLVQGATVFPISAPCAASYPGSSDPNRVTYTALNVSSKAAPLKSSSNCANFVSSAASMKGLSVAVNTSTDNTTVSLGAPASGKAQYTDTTLDQGLASWTGDNAAQALSLVRMTVNDDASWIVTSGGAPVMNSQDGTAWPGCLIKARCDWTNPLTDSLNDLFRWCPNQPDIRTPALGACEAPGDLNAAMYETNFLRWRVEGALWTAAIMSGSIPAGLFDTPIPAANLVPGQSAPLSMYFDDGSFATDPIVQLDTADPSELQALQDQGGGTVANKNFGFWNKATAANELPGWLRNAYINLQQSSNGHPLVHIRGQNPSGVPDFTVSLTMFANAIKAPPASMATSVNALAWKQIGSLMAGRQCLNPFGDSTNGQSFLGLTPGYGQTTPIPNWVQGFVSAVKTSVGTTGNLAAPFYTKFSGPNYGSAYGFVGPVEMVYVMYAPGFMRDDRGDYDPGNALWTPPEAMTSWFDEPPLTWHDQYVPATGFGIVTGPASSWITPTFAQGFPTGNESSGTLKKAPQLTHIAKTTAADRVRFAVNSRATNGDCDAAWQFTQAIGLACVLDQDVSGNLPPVLTPPAGLNNLDDLAGLSSWLKATLNTATAELQNAYVEHIPTLVVASAIGTPGALAGVGGQSGDDIVKAANAMLDMYSEWGQLMNAAQGISTAIEQTRNAIAIASTDADISEINATISELSTTKALAEDVAQIAQGVAEAGQINGSVTQGEGAAGQILAGAVGIVTDSLTMKLLNDLEGKNKTLEAEQIQSAILTLQQTSNSNVTTMNNALIAAKQAANNITDGVQDFASQRSAISYWAGKAAGADVWQCVGANGQSIECLSHVNTVLNRRYAGEQIRYQAALQEAKALSYIARRAIEQRIGIRLSDITTPIGPLDPPSTWADDVCHLSGINYKQLQSDLSVDAGEEALTADDNAIAGAFADAFIGDYVQKLTDFVQYYNIAYPQTDGNDQAVLSLRETLLGGQPSCLTSSPNLLTDPSRLYALRDDQSEIVSGWIYSQCAAGDATCLQLQTGTDLCRSPTRRSLVARRSIELRDGWRRRRRPDVGDGRLHRDDRGRQHPSCRAGQHRVPGSLVECRRNVRPLLVGPGARPGHGRADEHHDGSLPRRRLRLDLGRGRHVLR